MYIKSMKIIGANLKEKSFEIPLELNSLILLGTTKNN